jgi:5-methylcytosine-specific restriction endonuclease McrA
MRTCIKCKQEFPSTLEYFYKRGKYLDSYCKPCNNKKTTDYTKANREKRNATDRKRYARNPEKVIKRTRSWQKANPEKLITNRNRFRARKSGNHFEFYTLQEVFDTYGTNCYLCDMPINFNVSGKSGSNPQWHSGFHLDHFIGLNDGGSDTLENVRPSHAWCNLSKG